MKEVNKYGWNNVLEHEPPGIKLQLYTIAGTCLLAKYSEFTFGFITHWAYMLPSPTKQEGKLK
jgi:hypothetical protein